MVGELVIKDVRTIGGGLADVVVRDGHIAALGAGLAPATPLVAQAPSTSPEGASWMRYPAISPDGRTLAFSILCNDIKGNEEAFLKKIDEAAKIIVEHRP